jgi:hypothetical protein
MRTGYFSLGAEKGMGGGSMHGPLLLFQYSLL